MFNKILNVLNIVSQLILAITAVVSLVTAYVVFAPDDLPKPFHLVYGSPVGGVTEAPQEPQIIVVTATPAPEGHIPGHGIMLNMSTKIINLVDPTGRKYIRLTVAAEFVPDNPEYESLPEEEKATYLTEFNAKLNARMPIMDDTVITLLSTKTYEDLYTADGKEKLRMEIMETLQKKLPDLELVAIYFTEFVVQ